MAARLIHKAEANQTTGLIQVVAQTIQAKPPEAQGHAGIAEIKRKEVAGCWKTNVICSIMMLRTG